LFFIFYNNLTPFVPLSFQGEGERKIEEGRQPLLNTLSTVASKERGKEKEKRGFASLRLPVIMFVGCVLFSAFEGWFFSVG